MAREANARVDLTGLEDVFEAIKGHKNTLVGAALVLMLGAAVTTFVVRQVRESAIGPWRAAFTDAGDPWNTTPKDLDAARTSVRDPSVSTYLAYWSAIRRYEQQHDVKAANEALDTYRRDVAPGFRQQRNVDAIGTCATSPSTTGRVESPLDRLQADLREFDDWSTKHALPTSNVVPASAPKVTVVTPRGNIVIALFSDAAPKSCEDFLKIAPTFKDQFIAKAVQEKWIDVGQDAAGAALQTTALDGEAPPFETNRLSHVVGAVTFRKQPFSKGPFEVDIRVLLESSIGDDERTTVFGQVVDGLDLLTTISRDEKKTGADAHVALAQPVKIVDVQIGATAPSGK